VGDGKYGKKMLTRRIGKKERITRNEGRKEGK
jgi:hypothetical protein